MARAVSRAHLIDLIIAYLLDSCVVAQCRDLWRRTCTALALHISLLGQELPRAPESEVRLSWPGRSSSAPGVRAACVPGRLLCQRNTQRPIADAHCPVVRRRQTDAPTLSLPERSIVRRRTPPD